MRRKVVLEFEKECGSDLGNSERRREGAKYKSADPLRSPRCTASAGCVIDIIFVIYGITHRDRSQSAPRLSRGVGCM